MKVQQNQYKTDYPPQIHDWLIYIPEVFKILFFVPALLVRANKKMQYKWKHSSVTRSSVFIPLHDTYVSDIFILLKEVLPF